MKAKFVFIAAAAFAAAPLAAQQTQEPTPAPAEAPTAAEAPAEPQPSPAAAGDLVEGAEVRGTDGNVIGTIEAADAEGATVVSGSARLRLPLSNFQKQGSALRIGATRDQFIAAAAATQPS